MKDAVLFWACSGQSPSECTFPLSSKQLFGGHSWEKRVLSWSCFSPLMTQESRRFLLSYDSGTRDRWCVWLLPGLATSPPSCLGQNCQPEVLTSFEIEIHRKARAPVIFWWATRGGSTNTNDKEERTKKNHKKNTKQLFPAPSLLMPG